MKKKRKLLFVIAAFLLCATVPVMAQEDDDDDEKKMIREIVTVEMDRPPVVAAPKVETPVVTDKKHKNKKHAEEPPVVEETPVDTLSSTVPATADELKKRGEAWTKKKVKGFEKKDVAANGNSIQCVVTMPYIPTELNPGPHVDGIITMKVIIDCKEGKYRYTIKDIQHVAKNTDFSCGDVYSEIPACGTLSVPDPNWKRIRSFGLKAAQQVAANLKAFMKQPLKDKKDSW